MAFGCNTSGLAATIVAPNAAATTNGNQVQYLVLGNGSGSPLTYQWDLAASQLTSMVGSTVTGMGFRLPSGASTDLSATTISSFDLELSSSANKLGALSTNTAANIGSNAEIVYNAPLVIPGGSLVGGTGLNPFYVIRFQSPFNYLGGDLLMTLTQSNTATIAVDGNAPDANGDTSVEGRTEYINYPITEFVYGSAAASATPEPGSLMLLGLGISLFAGSRFRRICR